MYIIIINLGIGDWGLGIAQSPIPNPQSPYNMRIIFIKYNYNSNTKIN